MDLIRKGHKPTHRGIIGIEAAIVLIAFVIVAAALAFVVLNMGFSTTQKAKTAIIAAINEAGSSMEIAGKITGTGDLPNQRLNATHFPLKIISGGASSNLDGNVTAIKLLTSEVEYDNIYDNGPLYIGVYRNATLAWDAAEARGWIGVGMNPINGNVALDRTTAIIYWNINLNNNTTIDVGEHAVVSVGFASWERPTQLDYLAIEIYVPTGAPLTVDRTIPNITTEIVDLG